MFANKFTINPSLYASGSTATTINIPITLTKQDVDNAELIKRDFIDVEVEYAINPIIDYDKVRFLPLDDNDDEIKTITYDVYFLDTNKNYVGFFGDIGFNDDDIKFRKESFKQTNLYLGFYDSDNPLTHNLVSYITLYPEIKQTDLDGSGNIKTVSQIPVKFVLNSPILKPKGYAEGFYLYDYKSGLNIGDYKYLYMKAVFRNAKTGKVTNMMVKNTAQPITDLVHTLYTRYKLVRKTTGFYYVIDETYQGNGTNGINNIKYNTDSCTVTLYEINAT